MTTDDHKTGQPWSARPAVIAIVVSGVLFLGLLFGFRAFVLHPFSVPSESSVPNLMPGDYFFVSKSAYRFGDPQRGDIAVFRLPKDPGIDYVKRVIGMPGDRIQMIGGVLHINGQAARLEPETVPDVFKTSESMRFFRETLPGGRSYVVADTGDSPGDNTEEFVVPADHYFTLGDNRDNSADSRFPDMVGYIPRGSFVGPAAFLVLNSNGLPTEGRPQENDAAP